MININLIGHISGAVGIAVNVLIYQQKNNKGILFLKLLSDIVWMIHYLLISAYSGAAVALIGIVRELVFIFVKKHRERWLILFLVISFVSSYLTYKNIYSILPALASAISVISFWQKSPIRTKYLSLPISACMGVYSFMNGSFSGVCNEILTVISSVVSITSLYVKERSDKMNKIRVGVINWDSELPDDTYFGFHTTKSLGDEQFLNRIPYFAQRIDKNRISFNNRSQQDYDRELLYAIEAGIDYFAYVWYPKEASINHIPKNETDCSHKVYELRRAMEMYMKSPLNKKIGFCALLSAHPFSKKDMEEVAQAMKKPFYEKVGDRPLVYIFGGCRNEFVRCFKEICAQNGVAEPFAVALCSDGIMDNESLDGIDALCSYATTTGNVTHYCEHIKDVLDKNDKRSASYNDEVP